MNKLFIISLSFIINFSQAKHLHTFYGSFDIEEPVIHELINDNYFQRLHKVRQYGPRHFVIKPESYTRYDHSIGVMILLRRFGASLEEQVAGLLHDVSHTVFSHVGDFLFNRNNDTYCKENGIAYQDEIHYEFLKSSSLKNILEKHNFSVERIGSEKELFKGLEQELPDICADRLEYNLQGAYVHGILTIKEINEILDHIRYENDQWYFTSVQMAKKFSEIPLKLMLENWSSPEGMVVYDLISQVLMIGINKKALTNDDIHYGTDDIIWEKLFTIEDEEIKCLMNKIVNWKQYIKLENSASDKSCWYKPKFRGVNPFVMLDNKFSRLTDLDESFASKYYTTKSIITSGWHIKVRK